MVQFLGAVIRAVRIAVSSALNEQGQYLIWAWKVCIILLFKIWAHPMPIEHCEVPRLMTEPSV
jgi:hypothetical protein